jgi:hypothetical protein
MRRHVGRLVLAAAVLLGTGNVVFAQGNTSGVPVPQHSTKSSFERFFPAYASLTLSCLTCLAAFVVQQVASRSPIELEDTVGGGM